VTDPESDLDVVVVVGGVWSFLHSPVENETDMWSPDMWVWEHWTGPYYMCTVARYSDHMEIQSSWAGIQDFDSSLGSCSFAEAVV
jgi:hypothetical protein